MEFIFFVLSFSINVPMEVTYLFLNNSTLIVYLYSKIDKFAENEVDQFGFWEAQLT